MQMPHIPMWPCALLEYTYYIVCRQKHNSPSGSGSFPCWCASFCTALGTSSQATTSIAYLMKADWTSSNTPWASRVIVYTFIHNDNWFTESNIYEYMHIRTCILHSLYTSQCLCTVLQILLHFTLQPTLSCKQLTKTFGPKRPAIEHHQQWSLAIFYQQLLLLLIKLPISTSLVPLQLHHLASMRVIPDMQLPTLVTLSKSFS